MSNRMETTPILKSITVQIKLMATNIQYIQYAISKVDFSLVQQLPTNNPLPTNQQRKQPNHSIIVCQSFPVALVPMCGLPIRARSVSKRRGCGVIGNKLLGTVSPRVCVFT